MINKYSLISTGWWRKWWSRYYYGCSLTPELYTNVVQRKWAPYANSCPLKIIFQACHVAKSKMHLTQFQWYGSSEIFKFIRLFIHRDNVINDVEVWVPVVWLWLISVFDSSLWLVTHNLAFSARANSLSSLKWTTLPTCRSSSRTYTTSQERQDNR